MAFIATADTTAVAFAKLIKQAAGTKQFMQIQRPLYTVDCKADVVLNMIQHCGIVIGSMNAWASTPGLAAYAQEQVNNPAYDVVAEFQAMRAALVDLRDYLIGAFPKDANGWILYQSIQASGIVAVRTFTAAQLAAALAKIDAVIASIA